MEKPSGVSGCVVCAWRATCNKKFSVSKAERFSCPDFTMDVTIAGKASGYGIERCIISFMDYYSKIRRRIATIKDFSFIDPPLEQKKEIVLKINQIIRKSRISLHVCCEKEVLEGIPEETGITKSSCIPNDFLVEMFGGELSLRRDSGQRIKDGCGCKVSVDVGSYHLHPCFHNCLFCYANPTSDRSDIHIKYDV